MGTSSSRAAIVSSTDREPRSARSFKRNDGQSIDVTEGTRMSLKEEVDLLRRIPLFANVEPSKLKLLAFTSERIAFEAGHILFNQGDTGDAAYIVIEGEAEVLVNGPVGRIQVAVLGRNAIVGEIALLSDVPRTPPITAALRGRDLFVFERAVSAHPDCVPPADRLILGDLRETLPAARPRFAGRAVLAHLDIATGEAAASLALAASLAPLIAPLLRAGAV